MTNKDYAHVVVVADRSGSMAMESEAPRTRAQDATDGVVKFVKSQRAYPGETTVSLVEFNHRHSTVEDFGTGAAALTWECEPSGNTALLDAVSDAIDDTGKRLAAMPEDKRPARVFVVIVTDGEENSSTRTTKDQLAVKIAHQRDKYGWDFTYLSAGLDAFADAYSIGIPVFATASVHPSNMGVAYASSGMRVNTARAGGQSLSYTDADRATLSNVQPDADEDPSV